jgi:hypothetical protein
MNALNTFTYILQTFGTYPVYLDDTQNMTVQPTGSFIMVKVSTSVPDDNATLLNGSVYRERHIFNAAFYSTSSIHCASMLRESRNLLTSYGLKRVVVTGQDVERVEAGLWRLPANIEFVASNSDQTITYQQQPSGSPYLNAGKFATFSTLRGTLDPSNQLSETNEGLHISGNLVVSGGADVGIGTSSLENLKLHEWYDSTQMAGRVFGGAVTSNGDGTVHIDAGYGISHEVSSLPGECACVGYTGQISPINKVTWNDIPSLSLTDNAYNYIYYSRTHDTIRATTDYYSVDFTRDFTIGRAFRTGNDVVVRLCGTNVFNFDRRVQLFGEEVFPVTRAKGMIVGSKGTRNITVTPSVMWAELVNRFTTTAFDSSGTDRFTYWRRNGSGGWTATTGASQIDNINFDNGTGTLAELTANRVGLHWVYVVHDSTVHIVYGQGNYTQAQADAAGVPATLPGLLAAYATLAAKIYVVKSSNTLVVASAFDKVFATSAVASHTDLANLQGGSSGEYYHLTLAEYNALKALIA